MAGEIVATQLGGLAQHGVDVSEFAFHGPLTCEAEQVLDDVFGALRFLQNDLQVFARVVRNLRIFQEQVGKTENGGERVVHFVCNAGNQAADGGHAFGVRELGLHQGGVGDVGHYYNDAVNRIL